MLRISAAAEHTAKQAAGADKSVPTRLVKEAVGGEGGEQNADQVVVFSEPFDLLGPFAMLDAAAMRAAGIGLRG